MASIATTAAEQSAHPQTPDPFQQLLQFSTGYMISAALYPVVKLGIPDILANGSRTVADLARETGTNEDFLYRVMRVLASVGIFAEHDLRSFALTAISELLCRNAPGSVRDQVLWMNNQFHFHVWSEMSHALKTGGNATEHLFGKPCFEVFAPGEEITTEFNHAMTSISAGTIPAVLEAYSFFGIKTLVDVGGGHGKLISEILLQYPQMKGVLFDVGHVVAEAKPMIAQHGLADRLSTVAGSFFETVPHGGDAYIMQHIIHDWDDAKAITILKHVRRALENVVDGKLIILDGVVSPHSGQDFNKLIDLEMMLMPGGRERTEAEFRELLARAGFKLTRVVPTKSIVAVIEAVVV
ncbi:MAG TPA: methyltransferase [Terriglobales bacterium]|nr:methyltransferase [Terriglobales bacterium]